MKTDEEILQDLMEIIHFTEKVSARLHAVVDEAGVYRTIREEFAKSKRYTASVLLLKDGGSKLKIAETSLVPEKRKAGEKATGLGLNKFELDLNKSTIYSQVIRERKTVVADVSDTIAELFPRPLAHLISKILGYQKKKSILTPLYRHGNVIGALAMSSTELSEYLIPSVKNFAQHISNCLELADERTEREKKVERALRNSQNLLFNMIEQSPFSTWIADANGTNIRQNAACRKLFGIDYDEQTVGKYNIFSDPVVREQGLTEEIRKVFGKGETVRFTVDYDFSKVRYVNVPRATHRVLNATVFPIKDDNGKVINAVVQHEDITERKKAEEEREKLRAQLIHSAKMAAVGTLASGIAHEFNNLLQIMIGNAEFAQGAKKPENIRQGLNIILDTSDKAGKIIKDLLTFSKPKVSQKELCDITAPIESVLSLTENQLKKHNMRVVRKYEKIPMVEINKTEIQLVFLEIVINARDTMLPKGGKLEICVKRVKENAEVSFNDTGKGIEEENLNKVFEPFYTTKGTLGASTVPGTGLGLSVSYGIIHSHGGEIEAKSQVGQGTTFTIRLPVKEVGPKKRIIKQRKKKEVKSARLINILVVDDEEKICKILADWLSGDGHRVKSVLSGKKAIDLVRNEYFNVVFLDIIMLGIPGNIVLEEVKKVSPKTKVVMMTGKIMNYHLLKELRQKGASACIQKPFGIEEIREVLLSLEKHSRQRSRAG